MKQLHIMVEQNLFKFLSILLILVMDQSYLCIANYSIIGKNSNETQPKDTLTVFAAHFEPYVYIKNGEVYDGIEYHLVKMIGKALNREVLFITDNENVQDAIDNTK